MTGANNLAELSPALHRLDEVLDGAVKAAEAAYGAKAATDPYRGLYISSQDVQTLLAREPGVSMFAPLPQTSAQLASDVQGGAAPASSLIAYLREKFELTDFDMDAILVALAPEVDVRYERLYAYLQDDVTRRRPTVDLTLNLFCGTRESRWSAHGRFAPSAPMVRNRLVHLTTDSSQTYPSLLSQSLKLDDSVVRFLLGHPSLDGRLSAFCEYQLHPLPIHCRFRRRLFKRSNRWQPKGTSTPL